MRRIGNNKPRLRFHPDRVIAAIRSNGRSTARNHCHESLRTLARQ